MGRVHRTYLPGTRIYACSNCRAHLTNYEDIVSKSFQGRTGRAYLFNSVVNVTLGPTEERILNTGLHKVSDIYCNCCDGYLGWRYEEAFEQSQKYKENKVVLEKARMTREEWTLEVDNPPTSP
uniref:Protein yippee-like n=1 Tax=Cryptomonas curvata TaxID=233186 RepID=A0A6T8AD21_9CRYP|mmetsp:Transcript_44811/g.93856  ORF Transcript_44811/g.93856 Transcript_44811/m.93856 type:complete len:123 (+) Transcript_44811:336-704(+)